MFETGPPPRVYATPLGVDFSTALVTGIENRLLGQPPEALARVEIYVNTARTQRRLRALYADRGAGFLPRIRLVTDLATRPDMADLPPPIPPLRLRLQLSQLVAALLDREPALAPRSSLYGLSDSLAALMAEMQEEGVTPEDIAALDVGDHATHWQRTQAFLSIVAPHFAGSADPMATEARQSAAVGRLAVRWAESPPDHPVIVAGSTGSRGPTARFMQAVAGLPQGAVVLPGLDFDQPRGVWDKLLQRDGLALSGGEDHPQFRFARFAERVDMHPADIEPWGREQPANPARNRLISLALRPAPVTDQWLAEGPGLTGVAAAAEGLTLIEADTPQLEAATIALRLKRAAEEGLRAALICPDRTLNRQVTAALDRWRIVPDDSAGEPLSQTAPGRLLLHVAGALSEKLTAEALLVLLKHPLTHSARDDRVDHLRRARDLELQCLRGKLPFPTRTGLADWAAKRDTDPGAVAWATWVADAVLDLHAPGARPLAEHVAAHLGATRRLAAGPGVDGTGALWQKTEGEVAERVLQSLVDEAAHGGMMTAAEYRDFLAALLQGEEARTQYGLQSDIMIWGTLEARVQGADLVILAGLNEGTWPAPPGPDPWLNRKMRDRAGLRLPDRVIGLSAHDFQQSVTGAEVWLCRARRDAETETVPSRWLNRIVNLMQGASPESAAALKAMRARGQDWLGWAARLDEADAVPPATRPAPAPPAAQRPDSLSVTQVEKLIRDPYWVYARKVLDIKPIDPLRQSPDAPLRGTVLHDVLRRFLRATWDSLPENAEALLLRIADEVLEEKAPWPAARRMWRARIARVAGWFVATEHARRQVARPLKLEAYGEAEIGAPGFKLRGTADRIDMTPDGQVLIYDYKTGAPPSPDQEKAFNKQLWLEAAMAGLGAFGETWQATHIAYIGLGAGGKIMPHAVTQAEIAEITAGFGDLLAHYLDEANGFPSRRAMEQVTFEGDYDHLARFGEWDETQTPVIVRVGQ
ncbi:MAG: double-strand break repair protein AddB [Rhodobacteraceae bacterium CG17_big_fil_post_rev_8_21_14_2_50_65_11]|nr:MAG: double-strand break repair protein AddB [Rhodobacteraceae bacterium CG17_big_fil_post_rev_8_21_14_2_50_65_11]